MKNFLSSFILLIGFLGSVIAQTHEIAHKSHSGSPSTIDRNSPERFGEVISPPLIKIERIQTKTDTATILYFGFNKDNTETYRIENHPIFNAPDLNIDSLIKSYEGAVELVGFYQDIKIEIEPKKYQNKKEGLLPMGFHNYPKLPSNVLLIVCAGFAISLRNRWKVGSIESC